MYRIRVVGTGVAGGPYYFNHYFDGIDAESANLALGTFWDQVTNEVANDLTVRSDSEAISIDEATGNQVGTTPLVPFQHIGSGTGQLVPTQSQLVVRLNTDTFSAGRRIQGRMFFGPFQVTQSADGATWVAPLITAITGAWNQLLDAGSPETWEPVVWSRKAGLAAPITSAAPQSLIATLRSRAARGQ